MTGQVARSGQITITTAGTAVQGPSAAGPGSYALKGLPGNTGDVFVGLDSAGTDVTATNGYPLDAGEEVIVNVPTSGLDELWFDSSVNGEKIAWFKLT